jgi:hypothetical protein
MTINELEAKLAQFEPISAQLDEAQLQLQKK